MRIPVCFSCDNKYVPHLGVGITSILKNKDRDDSLVFYILDGGILEKNKEKLLSLKAIADFEIEFIKIDNEIFREIRVYGKDHITNASYYRLIIPDICNSEDKIIYLDCDLVVRTSLSKMLEIDLKGFYIGGIYDNYNINQSKRLGIKEYINSGVLLINVLEWRGNNITEKLFNWTKKNKGKIIYHDQDVLNGFFKQIKILDICWNTQIPKIDERDKNFERSLESAKIIHYVIYKPWKGPFRYIPMVKLYFGYLDLTPWRNLRYKAKLANIESNLKIFIKWLFSVRNIDKQYKVVSFFGTPVIKFVRKRQ